MPANPFELLDPAREILSRARALALGPRHPLERGEEIRPFFIVGSGRSGNTLLRRVLEASPDLHIPPEMYALSESIRVYRRNNTLPWPELVQQTLAVFEFHPQFGEFGLSLRPLAGRLSAAPEGARSLASILDALYRYHGEETGQPASRWGDKTPLNAFHLSSILAVFPRARFVHMLRDGVDVAHSYLRAGLQPDLLTAGERWRDSVAAVRAFMAEHAQICREVRYEDLVSDPAAVVEPLCAFLEIPFDSALLDERTSICALRELSGQAHHANVFKPIGRQRIGEGRRRLPPADKAALQRLIGADLERLGYEPAA